MPRRLKTKKLNLFFYTLKKIDTFFVNIFLYFIKIYQKIFSPDHSKIGKSREFSGCRYFPTCSQYAQITLKEAGFFLGLPKIIFRIFRCNPFSSGGVDFPSESSKQEFLDKNKSDYSH